jgi:hypothetical protein
MGFVRYIGRNHGDYVCSIWYSCLMFQDEHVMPWDFNGVFAHSMRPPVITSIKNEVGLASLVYVVTDVSGNLPQISRDFYLMDLFLVQDITSICIRRGGVDVGQSHNQWLPTISQSPNVISMSLVPITSLLNGIRGNGFVSHAVNLYLRCVYLSLLKILVSP